jgi:hypothetical protein
VLFVALKKKYLINEEMYNKCAAKEALWTVLEQPG